MSSQTMTAPAVGHRPPDAGLDTPVYDYGGSQNDISPASPPNDSRSDSAIRDAHNSAPSSKGLPAASIEIKTEPSEGKGLPPSENQKEINTQTAAGALLAQLLGNGTQSTPNPASAPEKSADQQTQSQNVKSESSHHQSSDKYTQNFTVNSDLRQDSPAVSREMHIENSESSAVDVLAGIDVTAHELNGSESQSAAVDTLSDPLNSKPSMDQPSLLPPLDFTAAPKNAFEALQQNEFLTAAYLSQGADLSVLGYQEGSTSVAGSEPRIQAFAKLEFDDGHFYVNTYSFILGRDIRAARAAHHREIQYRQAVRSSRAKSSSGGNASHTPNRMKREESAAILGSVVSDRGGIMGFDPDVPPHLPTNINISRRSSKSSLDESALPMHANPAQLQSTDYNALAMQSLQDETGDAKPVDALALLPSPDSCPTIPIHPPSTVDGIAAGHRGISRRHVRISYNFDRNLFEMEVMGRNGAFIGADWLSPGQVRPLHSGDYIQIGGVRIRFLLPDVPIGETGADRLEEQLEEEEEVVQDAVDADAEQELDDVDKSLSDEESKDASKVTKIVLKTKVSDPSKPVPSIEATGENGQPARRRGPGRPPKDGIMSKRERAELAREQKMAAKREANGGITPPPSSRPKSGKTTKESVGAESPTSSKPSEKRKYTKRKKADGTPMDYPLPSTEGPQFSTEQRPEEYVKPPPPKKRKPSRSPSPNYPPESAYTTEDLAKPPYNYAVLIFDALTEAGTPMTLKQIYRALKLKYPYFRFKCETEGWTSSVRHNLNGNGHLFMHAERDGKGWSWQLRPGASVEKEKKRRPSPPPAQPQPQQPAVPPAPQQYMPPISHSYAPSATSATMSNQHQHFQFPSISNKSFPAQKAPSQHATPYQPPPSTTNAPVYSAAPTAAPAPARAPAAAPVPTPASFPIPSTIRNNLPAAFAQTTPSTYTSPYASDPPPASQLQQPQAPRPGPHGAGMAGQLHQSPYLSQKPTSSQPPHVNSQPQYLPTGGPQFQSQLQQPVQSHSPQQHHHQSHQPHLPQLGPQTHPQPQSMPTHQNTAPSGPAESSSFNERANKAIDDFEAVLMEDYEDKNYIREVLRSARARVLGNATDSSFPGGEPKDEAVIMDVLRNLVGSLKDG